MLYLLNCNEDWYKVGYTSNIRKRMSAYACENPFAVLIGVCEGDLEDEKRYHEWYKDYPTKNEWVQLPPEEANQLCRDFQPYCLKKHSEDDSVIAQMSEAEFAKEYYLYDPTGSFSGKTISLRKAAHIMRYQFDKTIIERVLAAKGYAHLKNQWVISYQELTPEEFWDIV